MYVCVCVNVHVCARACLCVGVCVCVDTDSIIRPEMLTDVQAGGAERFGGRLN